MALKLTAHAVHVWADTCVSALADARDAINELNVYPVADHDTGTNAYVTFAAAAEALHAVQDSSDLRAHAVSFADTMLAEAKGNCGVILSQLIRVALAELVCCTELTAVDIADALDAAADAGYASVGSPVEGTILTVARSAADGARSASAADPVAAIRGARDAAQVALEKTPEQLDALAGKVDAGGKALLIILDATQQAITGEFDPIPASNQHDRSAEHDRSEQDEHPAQGVSDQSLRATPQLSASGEGPGCGHEPAYEVMYMLLTDDENIPGLRKRLSALGDSLVVGGGEGTWNVHVHVDDVGAAIEAGIAAGRPHDISVTHFNDQRARESRAGSRTVLSATTGTGLTQLSRDAGGVAMEFSRHRPLTKAAMREALHSCAGDEVIVLPNNGRYIAPFEKAAREARRQGVVVAVIPTTAQVQGLAALAVHDPAQVLQDDVVAMSSAAAHTRHGGLTVATEPGITSAGACRAGDVLGVVDGDFAFVGSELIDVSLDVVERLLSPGAEMVTLVIGRDADPVLATSVAEHVAALRPEVDTVIYDGGQENYPLFFAVE